MSTLSLSLWMLLFVPHPAIESGPGDGGESATIQRQVLSMGTWCSLEVEARDRETALRASEAAVRALEAVESRLSTWREDSELARVNHTGLGRRVQLSPSLSRDLHRAREFWSATGGAFDPTIGALVAAWGLRSGGREPSPTELRAALAASGFGQLKLQPGVARRLHADLAIEEGGFGKGVGLESALAALASAGAERAVIDLGGQLALFGTGDREIGCAHPGERGRVVLRATIDGGSLATSGNSERGILVGGEPRGHLIDPATGQPVPDFGSLSVWTRDAVAADALSTGLYVMGPERALEWAGAHPEVQLLILLLDPDLESGVRCLATAGWRGRLRPVGGDLTIQFVPSDNAERNSDDF